MQTCIITGANAGIGRSAAFLLAGRGIRVVLACRNIAAAEDVCGRIRQDTKDAQVLARRVDLSLVSDTARFAREYTDEFGTPDILINNAADFNLSRKQPLITAEGYEAQFATNLLAPYALVGALFPPDAARADRRIINIGTKGLAAYPGIAFDFDNINGERSYTPAKTYYQTKLGLLMISLLLRERIASQGVAVYAVQVPGVKVDLSRYPGLSPILKTMYGIKSRFAISPDEMARTYATLAADPRRNGFYFDERLQEARCPKNAYDRGSQERLWQLCQRLTRAGE